MSTILQSHGCTYEVVHHAPQKFQINKVFLFNTHLSQLAGYQVELRHLVVISLHDVLQLLQLLTAQIANQLFQVLQNRDGICYEKVLG